MTRGMNIAKKEILLSLAAELATAYPEAFNAERFAMQLGSKATNDAFRKDLQETVYRRITRFPSLGIKNQRTGKSVLLTGNRPFEAVEDVLQQLEDS